MTNWLDADEVRELYWRVNELPRGMNARSIEIAAHIVATIADMQEPGNWCQCGKPRKAMIHQVMSDEPEVRRAAHKYVPSAERQIWLACRAAMGVLE